MLSNEEPPTITWDIQYHDPPAILRHCKKCGKKSEFTCSGEFRINAQQKDLDVWLIYRCTRCNTTWNSAIYSRISPQKLGTDLLQRFSCNDKNLAMQYAMDFPLLQRNGAKIKLPEFQVVGEDVTLTKAVRLKIQSQYALPLKVSSILRTKLGISQREFDALVRDGRIQSSTGQDLRKCKLSSEIIVTISQQLT